MATSSAPGSGSRRPKSPHEVRVLLFDLGGVLVEFSGVRDIAPFMPEETSEAEIRRRWNTCPHTDAYMLGKLSRQDYAERFVRDWGLSISPERFLTEFRGWSKCLLPGAEELLASLRPRYRLAALSNSNELHWDRNTVDLGVTGMFELAISSHEVGLAKPDPAFYQLALERLGEDPAAVVFFDDLQVNVAAAAELGMRVFRVDGVDGVRSRLTAEGLM
jgi:putative hydrolase of the HAD superfamily